MEECKPLPVRLNTATVMSSGMVKYIAMYQGLTLVHVGAKLEQLQDSFMS